MSEIPETNKRDAIIQRYVIDHIFKRDAQKHYYRELFGKESLKRFESPIMFDVKYWFDWLVNPMSLTTKVYELYCSRFNKVFPLNCVDLAARVNDANPIVELELYTDINKWDGTTIESFQILKSLGEIILPNIVADGENEHYNLIEDSQRNILIERFEWYEGIKQFLGSAEMTTSSRRGNDNEFKFPNLRSYSVRSREFNIACIEMYRIGGYLEFNGAPLDPIVSQIIELEREMNVQIEAIKKRPAVDNEGLVVYSGTWPPIISSEVDIFSVKYPFTYVSPRFFSTSVNFQTARGFSWNNIIWRLEVATKEFAIIESVYAMDQQEVLFKPGHHITVTGLTRGEDGIPVLHGVILDIRMELPGPLKFRGGESGKQTDHRADGDSSFASTNDDRMGTPDDPFYIAWEENGESMNTSGGVRYATDN